MFFDDGTLQGYAAQLKREANGAIDKPPFEHCLIGPRMLSVSRECVPRIYPLAWRGTGDVCAEQAPPEKKNAGVKRLVVRFHKKSGPATVTVLLAPVWPDGAVQSPDLGLLEH
jgi:hypothetical protein